MNRKTTSLIALAEETVTQLVGECRKGGPLYVQNPPIVAHVSRTSKWLLNAIAKLRGALKHPRRTNDTV